MTNEEVPSPKPENPLYAMMRAGVPPGEWLLHTVGFKFKPTTDKAQQDELMRQCAALYERCGGREAGMVSLRVAENIDPRKGYGWVEVGVFASAEAFIDFHRHPEHTAFSGQMATLADVWVVLDIPIPAGANL